MNADDPRPGSREARAREALRGLPPAIAGAAFRARLKREFTAGTIAAPAAGAAPASGRRRPLAAWFAVPAAAAAAVALVLAFNLPPAWEVVSMTGAGGVTADGVAIAPGDLEALARRVRPGVRLEVARDAEVMLRGGAALTLVATPGSAIRVPSLPARWFARAARGAVEWGELRISTGPRFPGARLTIVTDEAVVEVRGTTCAVIREPAGTCVCLLEGHARIGARGAAGHPVGEGQRRLIHRDGRPPLDEPISASERMKLQRLRDAARSASGPADAARPAAGVAATGGPARVTPVAAAPVR